MPRHHRPPIPVTLTLPAAPPTPTEIDAILMTVDIWAGQKTDLLCHWLDC